MIHLAFIAALTAIGIDFGYEPASDGHLEYIIQIEPQLVESLLKGQDINSEIPRGLDIRHYRLTIGTAELPRIAAKPNGMPDSPAHDSDSASAEGQNEHVRVGYQPLDRGGECIIELDSQTLDDLQNYDLSGKLPADLVVTRFRISTRPGSAGDQPLMTDESDDQPRQEDAVPLAENQNESTDQTDSFLGDFTFPEASSDEAPNDETAASPEVDLGQSAESESSEEEAPPPDLPLVGDEGKVIPTGHTVPDNGPDPPANDNTNASSEPAKPWVPLILISLLLLMAIGGNIYLGWIALDARSRCRELLKKLHSQNPAHI